MLTPDPYGSTARVLELGGLRAWTPPERATHLCAQQAERQHDEKKVADRQPDQARSVGVGRKTPRYSATASGFDVVLYATGLSGATARDVTLVVDGRVMALDSVTPLNEVAGMDLIRLRVPRPASCTGSDCGEVTVSFGWPQVLRLALKAQ